MTRDLQAELCGGHHASCWPMVSEAMQINPTQIGEFKEFNKKSGVSVDYTADGSPIFTSRDQRRAYMRLHQYYDRNAGYGDCAPVNVTESHADRKRWLREREHAR